MNYRIILYYCVFHLTSFGLDATIQNFALKSIQSPSTVYNYGTLTYFEKSDGADENHYVFMEMMSSIPGLSGNILEGVPVVTTSGVMIMIIDITNRPTTSTTSTQTEDETVKDLYKIVQKDIEGYIYNDISDATILYKKNFFKLSFTNIENAKNFIDTLSGSVPLLDKNNSQLWEADEDFISLSFS